MNRQQIETTPVGPELDALVAEAEGIEFNPDYQCFSTSIDAAWELVEELREKYPMTLTYLRYFEDEGFKWEAVFRRTHVFGIGDTAPEAISRAYLLARLED